MRIVHVSDSHGTLWQLPAGDLYIFTGDVYPNFPLTEKTEVMGEPFTIRKIDKDLEMVKQYEWARATEWRSFFGNKDAPVVTVRGNHDFIDTSVLFGGEVYEIQDVTDTFNVLGLKIGGFRGINDIIGEWSDELKLPEFYERLKLLPRDLDVIVSHCPPYGILDKSFFERYGSQPYASHLTSLQYGDDAKLPALCCFGHVHTRQITQIGDTVFSNAATGHNVIDL